MTPRSKPEHNTPKSAASATMHFGQVRAPKMAQRGDLDQPRYRHQDDRGQHRLGQIAQQPGKEEHDHQDEERSKKTGEWSASAATFVNK